MKITVFTPTYNRKKLLDRCYKSLKNQSDKNFIWLIIDDGSTDSTRNIIKKYQKENVINIKYIYQKNGGKSRAHNTAVKICTTEFFLILDSDDCLDENSISLLNQYIKKYEKLSGISGFIGNKFDLSTKKCIGTPIINKEYTTGLELYQKYLFKGDTLRMYRTSVLKKNLFPEIVNEKFVPENVVFDAIDKKYKMVVLHDKMYYAEYQEDGYSNQINRIRKNNPIGYALSLKSAAETAIVFKKKINWTLLYIIWCKNMNLNGYNGFKNKLLYLMLVPLANILNILKKPKFFFDAINGKVDGDN